MKNWKLSLLSSMIVLGLTACGGGGGGGSSPSPQPEPEKTVYTPVLSKNCITDSGDTKTETDFTCFNWDNSQTEEYFVALIKKMNETYGIDAWRFDQGYQVPLANWKNITKAMKETSAASKISGFAVSEVWDGDGKKIETFALKDAAVESAFNFPLRYKFVQTIAGQEDESDFGYKLQPAKGLAGEWGYGNYMRYSNKNVMPTMFTDNHDLVRLGNLLFRWGFATETNVATDTKYALRHLLSFAFMGAYSGPITIYYGSEYGDYTKGYSKKLSSCGTGINWCDDHASRTQMVSSESDLADWQKNLRSKVAKIMKFRSEHPALYNGQRYHIYSTETAPADKTSANFYVDVKKAVDDSEAFVFVMSTSENDQSLKLNDIVTKAICNKAVKAPNCTLELVMSTTSSDPTNPGSESMLGNNSNFFVFNMPALSAKYYKVHANTSGTEAPTQYTATTITEVSSESSRDDLINSFTCFKGENPDKCGLIIYQVMVEAAPAGTDADGKGYGWGPSNHKGTLGGIQNSLDFIKGSGANALWVTPVFTTSDSAKDDAQKKTNASGYYATSHWQGDHATIDAAFGGDNSLRSLIQDVHAKNMYFILDGVFGHAKTDMSSDTTYINK